MGFSNQLGFSTGNQIFVFFPINGFSTGQTNRNCLVVTGTMEFYDFSIMLGII